MDTTINSNQTFTDKVKTLEAPTLKSVSDFDVIVNYVNIFIRQNKSATVSTKSLMVPIQGIYLRSKGFPLYNMVDHNQNWQLLCLFFEREGWNSRYGTATCWKNGINQNVFYLELNLNVKFAYRNAQDYGREIIEGEN